MYFKGAGLSSILIIGSTALLSACSQNSHQFCPQNEPSCSVPSPPRAQDKSVQQLEDDKAKPITHLSEPNKEYVVDSAKINSAALPAQSSIKGISRHSTSNMATPVATTAPAQVKVIEHIRKPETVVRTKVIFKRPATQTTVQTTVQTTAQASTTVPNLTSNTTYTIQLGAYRKASSREHAINLFPNSTELLLFKMRNDLLGLSYGQFDTLREAKAQKTWLLEQGITDFVVRRLPRNAQPLHSLN